MRVPDLCLSRWSIRSNWGMTVLERPYEIRYGSPTGCRRLAAAGVALPLHSRTRSLRLEALRRDRIDTTSGRHHGCRWRASGRPRSARCGPERCESVWVFGLGLSEPDRGFGRQMGSVAAGLVHDRDLARGLQLLRP